MTKFSLIQKILNYIDLETDVDDFDVIHKTTEKDILFKGTNLWILVFAFWKEVYASIGYSSFVYPLINLHMIVSTTSMVILTGIISAVYPAYKALKYSPAEATRSE
jgi:ABC-type antimicrobial peptide transport system permease subunit